MGKIEARVNKELKQKKELLEDTAMKTLLMKLKGTQDEIKELEGSVKNIREQMKSLEKGDYGTNPATTALQIQTKDGIHTYP